MVVLVIISLALLAGMVYIAISAKSDFTVRVAALGALALMIIAVIVCIFIFFKGTQAQPFILLPDVDPADVPPPSGNNPFTMVMFAFFLIALFVMVFILAMREHKRSGGKKIKIDDKTFGENW
jgi:divalent metal cation (Fe/Co/Zn/Cd) transporter